MFSPAELKYVDLINYPLHKWISQISGAKLPIKKEAEHYCLLVQESIDDKKQTILFYFDAVNPPIDNAEIALINKLSTTKEIIRVCINMVGALYKANVDQIVDENVKEKLNNMVPGYYSPEYAFMPFPVHTTDAEIIKYHETKMSKLVARAFLVDNGDDCNIKIKKDLVCNYY